MDEWEHEWMEEDKRRVTRHLEVAIEAVRVCQYAVWTGDQEQLEETLKWQKFQWDKLTLGWNWLVLALQGAAGRGEKGWNHNTCPAPSFLESTCLSTQTLNLQKKIKNE